MNREIYTSIENCKKYLKAHPKDSFELEGLNHHDAIALKNKEFGNYYVKIDTNNKVESTLNPYQLNSRLIISNKGVKHA